MKLNFLAIAAVLALGTSEAEAATVAFTRIASTDDAVFSALNSAPTINTLGVVAFSATNIAGGSSVNTGSGGAITEIAQSRTDFAVVGGNPKINDQNVVAFGARTRAAGAQFSVFLSDGGAPISVNGSLPLTGSINHPFSINDGGAVAFLGGSGLDRTVTRAVGGATTDIVTSAGEFILFRGVSINNDLDVAFTAVGDDASEEDFDQGVYSFSNGQLTEIAHTSGVYAQVGGNPSINDLDQVVFAATLDDGTSWIYLHSGGVTTPIFGGSDFAVNFSPALNNLGEVLFTASSADLSTGSILLYSGESITTLLSLGDILDGLVVQSFSVGPGALNDQGGFAFWVYFADLTQAIYRGSISTGPEVPLPAAAPMFLGGLIVMVWRRRRAACAAS